MRTEIFEPMLLIYQNRLRNHTGLFRWLRHLGSDLICNANHFHSLLRRPIIVSKGGFGIVMAASAGQR